MVYLYTVSLPLSYLFFVVMLPLDTITNSMTVNNPSKLSSYLNQLKGAGVAGVMSGEKTFICLS
jgi:hypothetical protein